MVLDEEIGVFVFVVYDGYGGVVVSLYLSVYLVREVLGEATLRSDLEMALKWVFKCVNDVVCDWNLGDM